MPITHPHINFEFSILNSQFPTPSPAGISDFPPTFPPNMESNLFRAGGTTFSGGAWHPDSPRVGVPGILSGRALMDVPP